MSLCCRVLIMKLAAIVWITNHMLMGSPLKIFIIMQQ